MRQPAGPHAACAARTIPWLCLRNCLFGARVHNGVESGVEREPLFIFKPAPVFLYALAKRRPLVGQHRDRLRAAPSPPHHGL